MEAERSLLCSPNSPGWKEKSFKHGSGGEDSHLMVLRGSPLFNSRTQRGKQD